LEGGGDAVGEEGFEGGVVLGEVGYNASLLISGILIFSELIDFTKSSSFESFEVINHMAHYMGC
jgi:hypothetical protein